MSAETLAAAAAASAPASGASLPQSAASSAAAVDEPGASVTSLEAQVSAHPSDASGWLALAELRRTQHDYAAARLAYSKVAGLGAMSAQSWADYADVLGSLADGSLTEEAAGAIDHALRLDPDNAKALWLKASQAHEQHRYAAALEGWRRLRKLLPADSPDLQIVEGNIAEAESLAAGAPAVAAGTSTSASTRVSGTVSLDARFSARVPRDATLFIYAKAADSPGPPLAVLRLTPNAWPVSFHLDDSMAMLPSRRLSQFEKVIVEARISRTGQAVPQSGDLYVTSPVVQPASAGKLTLLIDREIS
jgi:cytochrome c-type biogenesis protein CcmH